MYLFFVQLRKADKHIFYFSGHGGKNVLALSDGNLNLQSLIDVIEKIPAKNKIIILDSCHSGYFAISDTPALDLSETIETFVGRGYAVLASCSTEQTSGFEPNRQLSTYTSFLVDALTSRFLIREGKKSLESINEAIFHFAKIWNAKHPSQTQTPIFSLMKKNKSHTVSQTYMKKQKHISYTMLPQYIQD
mgnify:CR=1 FL=1